MIQQTRFKLLYHHTTIYTLFVNSSTKKMRLELSVQYNTVRPYIKKSYKVVYIVYIPKLQYLHIYTVD